MSQTLDTFRERGRDCVLTLNGKPTGLVQCKRLNRNLTEREVLQEIIKFTLHYLDDHSLISDINNFTYFFAAAKGFTEGAIDLFQDFNRKAASNRGELRRIVEPLIQKYRTLEYLSYENVESDLVNSLRLFKVVKVIPADIQFWLKSNPDLLEYFFQIMMVAKYDKKTYPQIVHTLLMPYLEELAARTRIWHIPPELQHLIDWKVLPVEIDRYFELVRTTRMLTTPTKRDDQTAESASIRLSQVEDTAHLVITGGAGAGKSTCLRYLCHKLSNAARDALAKGQTDVRIPMLLNLRDYGPLKLEDMLYLNLRSFNPSVTRQDFAMILENTFIVLLLDGIDEIKPAKRDDFIRELELIKQIRSYSILATARKQPELPPLFDSFPVYEIQGLSDEAIFAFVRAYLAYHEYEFLHFLEERGIAEIAQTPLLLTLCLIVYRKSNKVFDSLAGLYQRIVQLYSENWERNKKGGRADSLIRWDILTASLSFIAQRMVIDDMGYSVSRNDLLPLLSEFVDSQRKANRWSVHTIDDLLDQLLAFNLLEISQNNISFWHPSFRDYFAALKIANEDWEQLAVYVQNKKWAAITVFLGGLLNEPEPLYQLLSEISAKGNTPQEVFWPIDLLTIIGNNTTRYILKAAGELGFVGEENGYIYRVQEVLLEREYEGKHIIRSAFDLLISLQQTSLADFDSDDFEDYPSLEHVNVNLVNSLFKQTLVAVSEDNIMQAQQYQTRLAGHIENALELGRHLDDWLTTENIRSINDFRAELREGTLKPSELKAFCRNTTLRSSNPFLQAILDTSQDRSLTREAHLAIVCINLRHN